MNNLVWVIDLDYHWMENTLGCQVSNLEIGKK